MVRGPKGLRDRIGGEMDFLRSRQTMERAETPVN